MLMFLNLGGPEILLIAVLVLLFFGGKKIPQLMNGLGKGVRSFKEGVEGKTTVGGEDEEDEKSKKDGK
ncbi:MAG: twin-arginine translocase TatA/TatE family subunit [Bacteroidales bacterium]|jgi:sec-independent protein translocase protein TatA|nr:twin-arginine translocase TatA/TatE family subunit [Bacteroidales bacterium]